MKLTPRRTSVVAGGNCLLDGGQLEPGFARHH